MKHDIHTSSPGRLIALGEIVGTHGIRGLLRFHPYDPGSDPPPTGFSLYLTPRTAPGSAEVSKAQAVVLDDARPHGNVMLLRVNGIDGIEAAERLVGGVLSIRESDLPAAAPGEVYVYQLTGLDVFTNAGKRSSTRFRTGCFR